MTFSSTDNLTCDQFYTRCFIPGWQTETKIESYPIAIVLYGLFSSPDSSALIQV